MGVSDEEILMSKDVEIGERYREKGKGIETCSGIPSRLIYRPEGSLQGMPLLTPRLKKEER
jgi:hypothetical protein